MLNPHKQSLGGLNGNGFRRFRNALVVIPRKNGKSSLAAPVGLRLLALDKEPGSEVYSCANNPLPSEGVLGDC